MNTYTRIQFTERKNREQWRLTGGPFTNVAAFSRYVTDPGNAQRLGTKASREIESLLPEIRKLTEPPGTRPPTCSIEMDEIAATFFVALTIGFEDLVRVWEYERKELHPTDGASCLRMLAPLALGTQKNVDLRFSDQEDKAFMWKAPSVHPLQALENGYQREVREAEQAPGADPIKAQSETLARYFLQGEGLPVDHDGRPPKDLGGDQLAAVRMNHLIATFYLFRLLVRYQVESNELISEDLRIDLSGNLTKLLHNGDRNLMGWLTNWLTAKISELGKVINELNPRDGERRVMFFLKGGRALNYFLGTPEKGENDWDTQVVINPALPAREWYDCLAEVHDKVLTALEKFKAEFKDLVETNKDLFGEYLMTKTPPEAGDDEEPDENDVSDLRSRGGHANCKAELIDIGIPRRDSAAGLEEWTRLSADGALEKSPDGIYYPHREYYLNEYLTMIREAFAPNADTRKAPKRITRFGLILARGGHKPSDKDLLRWEALPKTKALVENLPRPASQELFRLMMPQFVEAYNLLQDKDLTAEFDQLAAGLIVAPPKLPGPLASLLDENQKVIALDVGVAHQLSERMNAHWQSRDEFFGRNDDFFVPLLRDMFQATSKDLSDLGGQFAIAGSYAARLHARHLGVKQKGLEPVRRILVKLQCPNGHDESATLNAVREKISMIAKSSKRLQVVNVPDPRNGSLVLFWAEKTQIGDFLYAPLVVKLRGAVQPGSQLPVLASIDGLPTLDLRYLATDYLRKASKIDERGARVTLASATAAVSEMLSRFDIVSDEDEEDD